MAELTWVKGGRTVTEEGTTIIYHALGTDLSVESRKRHIPHSNRGGTWDHTTYAVVKNGKDIAEKWTLQSAKEYAQQLAGDPEAEA